MEFKYADSSPLDTTRLVTHVTTFPEVEISVLTAEGRELYLVRPQPDGAIEVSPRLDISDFPNGEAFVWSAEWLMPNTLVLLYRTFFGSYDWRDNAALVSVDMNTLAMSIVDTIEFPWTIPTNYPLAYWQTVIANVRHGTRELQAVGRYSKVGDPVKVRELHTVPIGAGGFGAWSTVPIPYTGDWYGESKFPVYRWTETRFPGHAGGVAYELATPAEYPITLDSSAVPENHIAVYQPRLIASNPHRAITHMRYGTSEGDLLMRYVTVTETAVTSVQSKWLRSVPGIAELGYPHVPSGGASLDYSDKAIAKVDIYASKSYGTWLGAAWVYDVFGEAPVVVPAPEDYRDERGMFPSPYGWIVLLGQLGGMRHYFVEPVLTGGLRRTARAFVG